MPRSLTTDSSLVLLAPDSAVAVAGGQVVVDLSALPEPGTLTTGDVANASALAGDTLTDALDSADTRITAAQDDADTANAGLAAVRQVPTEIVYVHTVSDLPAAIAGVRTLAARTQYTILAEELDLGTDRLVANECVVLAGISPECSRLKTNNALPIVTAADNIDIRLLTLQNTGGPCVLVDGGAPLAEVTANLVSSNFTGSGEVVRVEDGAFFIGDRCAWLSCAAGATGLRVAGTVLGIAVSGTASRGHGAGFTFVSAPAGTTVVSRIRLNVCNIDSPAGGTGVSVDPSAVSDERVVLLGCAFSGAGAAVAGVTSTSNKAYFKNNIGLESTYPRAAYTVTAGGSYAATSGVPFKLVATTTEQDSQLFTITNNRATYTGTKRRIFLATASATLETSTINQVVRLYFAVNGTVNTAYTSRGTTQGPSGDRLDNLQIVGLLTLDPTQYVEVWGEAVSASPTVQWTDGQLVLTEIGG